MAPDVTRWAEALQHAFLAVDRPAVERLVGEAAAVVGPARAAEDVLIPALERLGEMWEQGSASLSQVYMAGRYADEVLSALLPPPAFRVGERQVGVAVLEDQHVPGKRHRGPRAGDVGGRPRGARARGPRRRAHGLDAHAARCAGGGGARPPPARRRLRRARGGRRRALP